jgi:hypothetical protein
MQHYNNGLKKLQQMVNHTDEDGVWEIMLCDVKQYALSRQKAEQLSMEKSSDWYSKYLEIMSRRSHRDRASRHRLNLNLWRKLKDNLADSIFNDDEGPTAGGA